MIEVIEQLDAPRTAEIRAFLAAAGPALGACGEHDPRWLAVLRQGLGHRPLALLARQTQSGPITGYLPLALVKSKLFGRFLVSLPYLNRAGVVAADPAVAGELVRRAAELADEHDVSYLELRHHSGEVSHALLEGRRDEKVRMVLQLPADPDTLRKGLDAKVRNQVKKAEKEGLAIRWGGLELLNDFYDVFSINMRDLGTPVYPRKLFAQIITQLDGDAELAVVDWQNKPVAVALLVHDASGPGSSAVPSASSLRQFNHTNANMWMYYQMLLRAMSRGKAEFDFGRSSLDSGTYKFKKQWGALPRPTVWQYHVRRGDINAMRPDSPSYRRKVEMWQRLPVWVTRLIGPSIVRGIP